MAFEYSNRVGTIYYLLKGTTKKGNPRYFFSRSPDGKGTPIDAVPDGYEVYEHPENAQVFLRKIKPQAISDLELHLVEKSVKALKRSARRYLVDRKDTIITIYESCTDFERVPEMFEHFGMGMFPGRMERLMDSLDHNYQGVMRFCLVDQEKRVFEAERFCYRGSIDDWIFLKGPDRLTALVKHYVKYLGTDEFYEQFGVYGGY